MKRYFSVFLLSTLIISCNNQKGATEENPPSEGFNAQDSDAKAIEIADAVMRAQGGRAAWDNTRHFAWNFFDRRDLVWDKKTGNVRIEIPGDTSVFLINIFTMEGKVVRHGKEITEPKQLADELMEARKIWINDSYWLVMPFKLKDSGVTLKYLREEATQQGESSEVLQLTFKSVGVTPNNKYEVWVDKSDELIKQWAFFRTADLDTPNFVRPWDNYKEFGSIKLSSDRSDDGGPKRVRIFDELPEEVYTSFEAKLPE